MKSKVELHLCVWLYMCRPWRSSLARDNKGQVFPSRVPISRSRSLWRPFLESWECWIHDQEISRFPKPVRATVLKDISVVLVEAVERPVFPPEDAALRTGCFQPLDSASFLWAVPDTRCQSLFSLSSVYLEWPCSRGWPFLSSDVLISWIKLCSWSQSSG